MTIAVDLGRKATKQTKLCIFRFALDTADFDYVSYKDGKLLTEESNDTSQEVDDAEDGSDDGGDDDGNVDGGGDGDDKEEDTKLEEENSDGSENDSGKN